MREKSTESVVTSSPTGETLEAFARQSMQQLLQRMLEEEVEGLLGRGRYERRPAVDAAAGDRNGLGKPRRLSLSNGTIILRRPRVRGLDERFESRLLPAKPDQNFLDTVFATTTMTAAKEVGHGRQAAEVHVSWQ